MLHSRLSWAPRVNELAMIASSVSIYPAVHCETPIRICTSRTDVNQRKCGWRAQCLQVKFLVGAMSNQNDLVGYLRLIHMLMQNIFDVVDLLSREQDVQILLKLVLEAAKKVI